MLWGGILNLSTRLGAEHKISLQQHLQPKRRQRGDRAGGRERGVQRRPRRHPAHLHRAHACAPTSSPASTCWASIIWWTGRCPASRVDRNEPDRSDIAYITEIDPVTGASTPGGLVRRRRGRRPGPSATSTSAATRGAATTGCSSARRPTRPSSRSGGAYRAVDRDVDSRAFDITNRGLSAADRAAAAGADLRRALRRGQPAVALHQRERRTVRRARTGSSAGYAQVEMPLGSRLRLIGGARVEHWDLDLNTLSPQGVAVHRLRGTTPTCCRRSR